MKIQIIYCHPSNKSYTFEIYGSPRIATALNYSNKENKIQDNN